MHLAFVTCHLSLVFMVILIHLLSAYLHTEFPEETDILCLSLKPQHLAVLCGLVALGRFIDWVVYLILYMKSRGFFFSHFFLFLLYFFKL